MRWPQEGSIAKQKATYSTVQQGFSHISETTQGPLTDSLNQHFHWLWWNNQSQIKDGRTSCHLSSHSSFHVNDPEVTNYCSALIQNQLLLTRWQHSSVLIEWCGAFNLWPQSLDILHGCNAFTRQSHVHVWDCLHLHFLQNKWDLVAAVIKHSSLYHPSHLISHEHCPWPNDPRDLLGQNMHHRFPLCANKVRNNL